MRPKYEFTESHSSDPVLREMAAMASRILSDPTLSRRGRANLIQRLEVEYRAYMAWNRQYASYFKSPPAERGSSRDSGQRGPKQGGRR